MYIYFLKTHLESKNKKFPEEFSGKKRKRINWKVFATRALKKKKPIWFYSCF